MKKQIFKYLFIFSVLIGISQLTNAQTRVYVKVQPKTTVVARTKSTHKGYVWVGDEWKGNGAAYQHQQGHWVAPRKGYVWVAGHWGHEGRGYYWVAGHWRKI